jgi:hypothetical protein
LTEGIGPRRGALTVRRRRDTLFTSNADERHAALTASRFMADKFNWTFDQPFIDGARELLGLPDRDPCYVRWRIERAIESGELVTISDDPPLDERSEPVRSSGGEFSESQVRRMKGFARTRMELLNVPASRATEVFKRFRNVALRTAASAAPPALPGARKLTAADGPTIWAADPGDVLPDGSIATALSAEPFVYVPHTLSDEVMELAASTNNPKFAAKMLGYGSSQFREMVHRFKNANGIGPAEDLEWLDNGDVYFKGVFLDNFHEYQD